MKPEQYPATDFGFDRSRISGNALATVDRLQMAGFDGYLVGGCVRDLLLGGQPKDFDVATNASPEQVRKLFDRARIIGRRFKLVHVRYGRGREREVIEVATFRASPGEQVRKSQKKKRQMTPAGRILDDNVYGSIDADAARRDFTINALYYDPKRETVLDFIRAMDDIRTRTLNVIGSADKRFIEDPVRMLRVVRFQARMNLSVPPGITTAINKYSSHILDVPAARLFDEVLKLFHYEAAVPTWKALCRTPLANHLFPQTMDCMDGNGGHRQEALIISALRNTDRRVADNLPVVPGFLFAVFLWGAFQSAIKARKNEGRNKRAGLNELMREAGKKIFDIQSKTISVPWRARESAMDIWVLQSGLERCDKKALPRILEQRWFRAAYDFLLLRCGVGEVDQSVGDRWTDIQKEYGLIGSDGSSRPKKCRGGRLKPPVRGGYKDKRRVERSRPNARVKENYRAGKYGL